MRTYSDLLAERAVQIGGTAAGTLEEVARRSRVAPYPVSLQEGLEHVKVLGKAIGLLADSLRDGINTSTNENDMVTADILTEVVCGLNKLCWMVESHLSVR